MKTPLLIVALVVLTIHLFACSNNKSTSSISKDTLTGQTFAENSNQSDEYILAGKDSLSNILNNACRKIKYEFIDLYKDTDTIPANDYLVIVKLLKGYGFKVAETGRGNWMNGPRIISITLEKESCRYRVDKLYYSLKNSERKYKVTERLECSKKGL